MKTQILSIFANPSFCSCKKSNKVNNDKSIHKYLLNNNIKAGSRKFFLLMLFSTSIFLQSCQKINKERVKETVVNFFSAYKDDDFSQIYSIYPNFANLKGPFRKSSSIDIEPKDIVVAKDNKIIVSITNHWTNSYGVDYSAKMKIYIEKQDETYKILDTKNFCVYDDDKLYKFACKTGAISFGSDTTDVSISAKMLNCTSMYDYIKNIIKGEIENGLTINNGWKWETGYYSDYASGRAIVTNNSSYPIKRPKYKITYYKSDNKTIVTTDDGVVCYDILEPGQSKSFSWYTSYAGNAQKANVKVICDDEDWIDELVLNSHYDGTEYEKLKQYFN